MANTNVMAFPSPVANMQQYLARVEEFPRLDEHEERELAERYQQTKDLNAAWHLVTSHLRHVVYIARGYGGYGLSQEDLIQEGNVGLMKAVQRFDPARGARLISYATYWIRAQIHEFILRNWRIVRIATTKAKRRLFYKLRSTKQRLEWLRPDEADQIADAFDVRTDDVLAMDASLYSSDVSFDAPRDAPDDAKLPPADLIEDTRLDPGRIVSESDYYELATDALAKAVDKLDERSRAIITARWLADEKDQPTLQALGDKYGISAERVRQIEQAAMKKLRNTLSPAFAAAE